MQLFEEKVFTADNISALLDEERGWFAADGVLGVDRAGALQNGCLALASPPGSLSGAHYDQHFFSFGKKLYPKPHIYEIDLHDRDKREASPTLRYIFHNIGPALVTAACKALPGFDLIPVVAPAIKVQINAGGAFPAHYDNPGHPNKRKVTCIFYLNEGWVAGDGGEIEFIPFLGEQVDVPPLFDRIVVFRSDLLLHSVAPWTKTGVYVHRACLHCGKTTADLQKCMRCQKAFFCNADCQKKAWKAGHKLVCVAPAPESAEDFKDEDCRGKEDHAIPHAASSRLCFTVWIDSTTQGPSVLRKHELQFQSWDQAEAFFKTSTLQRNISRAVYIDEYEQGLIRCVGGTDAEGPMCKGHRLHAEKLHSVLTPLINEMRSRKKNRKT